MAKQGETSATIQVSREHQRAIQEAIKDGLVHSVDEIIEIALAALPQSKDQGGNSRQEAVRRMEEFGEKYHLGIGEPITRSLLHEGHRY